MGAEVRQSLSQEEYRNPPQSPFTKGEARMKLFFEFTLDQAAQRILIPSAKSDLL